MRIGRLLLGLALSSIAGAVVLAGCSSGGGGASDPLDHLVISPDGATVDTATSLNLKATGVTKAGRHVAVTGTTWTATSPGSVDASGNFTATSTGDSTVTANAQGVSGTGTIHVTATGSLSVKVVDAATGTAIAGATAATISSGGVIAVYNSSGTTGVANLVGAVSGAQNVHVTAPGHWPFTAYGVKGKSLLIPLRQATVEAPGSFSGSIDFSQAYGQPDPPAGHLWVAVAGPAIQGNVLSKGLSALLGPNRPLSIGGFNLNAPSNVFVFGTTTNYIANAPPGPTVGWAIGGDVNETTIFQIIQGGAHDIGAVIAQLIPVFNGFYYQSQGGVTVASNQTVSGVNFTLTDSLSNTANVTVPPRPWVDPSPLIVGAADLGATGFVPTGLNVISTTNGVGSAAVSLAPLNGALSSATYAFLTVSQQGGLGSSSSKQQCAVLSRGYPASLIGQVAEPAFLAPPPLTSISGTSWMHTYLYPATPGADVVLNTFVKSITQGSNLVAQFQWDVLTAGSASGFVLPAVAGTNGASSGAAWSVQSLGLESETYDALLTPGSPVGVGSYIEDADQLVLSRATVQ